MRLYNSAVALTLRLGPNCSVVKSGNVCGQISGCGAAEEQLLRKHAPRRINTNLSPLPPPSRERRRHVCVHFAMEFAVRIAQLPNLSLQRLERSALAVPRHQPMHIGNRGTKARFLSLLIPRGRPEALPFFAPLLRS